MVASWTDKGVVVHGRAGSLWQRSDGAHVIRLDSGLWECHDKRCTALPEKYATAYDAMRNVDKEWPA